MPSFTCIDCGWGSLVRSNFKLDKLRQCHCRGCWAEPPQHEVHVLRFKSYEREFMRREYAAGGEYF